MPNRSQKRQQLAVAVPSAVANPALSPISTQSFTSSYLGSSPRQDTLLCHVKPQCVSSRQRLYGPSHVVLRCAVGSMPLTRSCASLGPASMPVDETSAQKCRDRNPMAPGMPRVYSCKRATALQGPPVKGVRRRKNERKKSIVKPDKPMSHAKSVAIIGTRGYPSYYGGFETAVRKIVPHLADAGWDVNVYGRAGAIKPVDPNLDSRIRSTLTPGLDTKSLSTLSYGLTAVLHALFHRPDVALVMNVANGFWLPLLRLMGIPTVVNVDGIEWERAKWGRAAKFMFRAGAAFTARFADVLVSDSIEIQKRWRVEFGRDSQFIPYGGDEPGSLPVVDGLQSGEYILMVARFVPENSILEFFSAVETLAQDHPVVIVGSSGYGGELDEHAAVLGQHENVSWLGHVSDDQKLLSLWQHAGAYFHGHSVGGTNPALVQAMAAGAPVVARRTPYNLEVLGSDEQLVDPEPSDIVRGIKAMLSDMATRDAVRHQNIRRARDHYNWPGVSKAYEVAIRDAVRGPRRREDKASKKAHSSISRRNK